MRSSSISVFLSYFLKKFTSDFLPGAMYSLLECGKTTAFKKPAYAGSTQKTLSATAFII
jgi:hypothetical protein